MKLVQEVWKDNTVMQDRQVHMVRSFSRSTDRRVDHLLSLIKVKEAQRVNEGRVEIP